MLKAKLSFFFISFTLALSAAQQSQKLNVLVLYESLCPDSERFMAQQLGPSYDALAAYIDIVLVPFGKSKSVYNGAKFFCQHGPAECDGNRKQSCVLDQTTDQAAQVKFVVCQMAAPDRSSIDACAEAAGLSSNIDLCMNTSMGTMLQLQAERITRAYMPAFVPTIIYDGVFNQQLQDNSIHDFYGTVCSQLRQRGAIPFNSPICF